MQELLQTILRCLMAVLCISKRRVFLAMTKMAFIFAKIRYFLVKFTSSFSRHIIGLVSSGANHSTIDIDWRQS